MTTAAEWQAAADRTASWAPAASAWFSIQARAARRASTPEGR